MGDGSLVIEGARIIFRNFAGREGKYNREGERNFTLCLDTELAKVMEADGWNVRYLSAREDGDEPQAIVQVTVNYRNRPPNIVLVNHKGRTTLPEKQVEILDWVDIKTVDLIINPYNWAVNGKTGITAYLKSLFVTLDEDELDLKYADLDDLTPRGGKVED